MSDRWTGRFLALLLAYVAVHVLVRVLTSGVVTIDDAREAVLGQTLAWGYQPRQPPLYNWLVWGAFQLFGVSVLSLTLVKYTVLFLAYGLVYASARAIIRDRALAVLATCSLVLVFPISWTFHQGLTHSAAVLAACAATFYVLLRLEASGSFTTYLALGLVLGLGMLSKFTYGVFAAALLLAALMEGRFRRRLLDARALLSLAVAGLVLLPFTLWFSRRGYDLALLYAEEVRIERGNTYRGEVVNGLYYIVRMAFYYLTPLWLVFLLLFPSVYRHLPPPPYADHPGGRLLGRFFVCLFTLLTVGALSSQLAYLKWRWLVPAFFLLPLYAFWRLDQVTYERRRLRWLAGLLVATELAIIGGIVAVVTSDSFLARPSDLNKPYDVLVDRLAMAGFTRGTIVVGRGALAGSLRIRFPDSRVISLEHPYYVPLASGSGQCLVVEEKGDATRIGPDIQEELATALDARLTGAEPVETAEAPYHWAPGHVRRIHFILLPEGLGQCR